MKNDNVELTSKVMNGQPSGLYCATIGGGSWIKIGINLRQKKGKELELHEDISYSSRSPNIYMYIHIY